MTAPAKQTPASIDLNCDLGEGAIDGSIELTLLECVTSANIACGGHAGDRQTMLRLVTACEDLGVAIGAHPSYPDRENFGRKAMDISTDALEESLTAQLLEMERNVYRARLRHVKPHGALYHGANTKPWVAEAIARSAAKLGKRPVLVGQAGASALDFWRSAGFRAASESFADRRYESDGTLRSREHPDSLITSPAEAADQARRIATGEGVVTSNGTILPITADTICIHSDTPGSVAIAREVRKAIESSGVKLRAFS